MKFEKFLRLMFLLASCRTAFLACNLICLTICMKTHLFKNANIVDRAKLDLSVYDDDTTYSTQCARQYELQKRYKSGFLHSLQLT